MANNVTLNNNTTSGAVVATDDVSGVHYQKVKLAFGAEDVATQVADAAGSRLPVELGDDNPIALQTSQISGTTNTTTTRQATTGLAKYKSFQLVIEITGAGTATGLLQLFLQDSADGGNTWDDLVASNTFAFGASVTNQVFSVQGEMATTKTQGSAGQQETLAAGNARQGPFGDRIRVREKVSGVSGSPAGVTYKITAVFKR